jgi:hypothetical protein
LRPMKAWGEGSSLACIRHSKGLLRDQSILEGSHRDHSAVSQMYRVRPQWCFSISRVSQGASPGSVWRRTNSGASRGTGEMHQSALDHRKQWSGLR